jgi:hypothetical protein
MVIRKSNFRSDQERFSEKTIEKVARKRKTKSKQATLFLISGNCLFLKLKIIQIKNIIGMMILTIATSNPFAGLSAN